MDHEAELPPVDLTGLLKAWAGGDAAALASLTPLVYDELHGIAHRYMRRERRDQTLRTTALLNEAYLRLVDVRQVDWRDRTHFFAISARIMRRIIVDAARARSANKRGGENQLFSLDEEIDASPTRSRELINLDDALDELARMDPRKADVIELRFFGGLSVEETAMALQVSPQTVLRDWKLAKAWMSRELSGKA